jgi:uncharacterized Zn finger protein
MENKEIKKLKSLLVIARCPNAACDNKGKLSVLEEDKWVETHCQWCHEAEHCCPRHEWDCISPGVYESTYKCKNCGQLFTDQVDAGIVGPPKEGICNGR